MKRFSQNQYSPDTKKGPISSKPESSQPSIKSTLDSNFLIDNIKDAVLTIDKEYCIQSWNPGATEIYGWTAEEAIGQKPYELLKTNYGKYSFHEMSDHFKNYGYFRGEIVQQTKSGKEIQVFMSASALFTEEGEYKGAIAINKDITQRKNAEREILQLNRQLSEKILLQENQLLHVFERITDGFMALDRHWCFTYINRKAALILKKNPKKLIGKNIWKEFQITQESLIYTSYLQAFEKQTYQNVVFFYPPFQIWVENHIYPSPDGVSIYFRDITKKKKAEESLNKTNRLYQFISRINQMILRTTSINELYREACSIAIETGKYRMAWIGLIDEKGEELQPVMIEGYGTDYVNVIKILTKENKSEGMGPGGRCIREKKTVFCNDIENDPSMTPWKDAALSRNYRSVISLPICKNGAVFGVFSLYAENTNRFDDDEISLLNKVGDDINFGIANIENEERKKEIELSLIKYNEQLKLSQDIAGIGYWEQDLTGHDHFWSEQMYQLLDVEKDDMVPNLKNITDRIHPEDRDFFIRELENTVQNKYLLNANFRYVDRKSNLIYFSVIANIMYNINGEPKCLKGTLQDISQLKKAQQEILNEKLLSDWVINGLPGIFMLISDDGKFLRWNSNLEMVSGYTSEEISTMHMLDFFAEKEKPLLKLKIAHAFEKGKESVQTNLLLKSNETVPYYLTGISIFYKNKKCFMGIGIDFSERQNYLEEIESTSIQMQELSAHLITIREEERKRIGRELHDELGQQLTAMKMDLSWMNKKIPEDMVQIRNKMTNVLELLEGSNASVRRILSELRPSILDQYGLLEALNWYAVQFNSTTGIAIKITCTQTEIKVAEDIATTLFRIFQESLTNIARYAKATDVAANIEYSENEIRMNIVDNGIGFDPQNEQPKTRKAFGILGMKERVRAVKGKFTLSSKKGNGTSIKVSIPINFKPPIPLS